MRRCPPQPTPILEPADKIARLRAIAESSAAQARQQAVREYLEGMAMELSHFAEKSGDAFLAYLFCLAAQEAHALQDHNHFEAA